MKVFERAIRRAEIPIRMSEGFNPRQKNSFPIALAVGIEGIDEVFEMELNEWVKPSTLLNQLMLQLPQGIELTTVEPVPPGENAQVADIKYRINLAGKVVTQAKIDELLRGKDIFVSREKDGIKRSFNIRPSIIDIVAGTNFLELRLRATSEGTARPEEVLTALGGSELDSGELDCRLLEITRTQVKLAHS